MVFDEEIGAHVQQRYFSRLAPALKGMTGAVTLCATTAGALIARQGTTGSSILAGSLVVCAVAASAGLLYWLRRRTRRSDVAAIDVVRTLEPALAKRLERASALRKASGNPPLTTSVELSELHWQRLWQKVPLAGIEERGRLLGQSYRWFGWSLLGTAIVVCVLAPYRVLEGANVLFARDHRAPFSMDFIVLDRVTVQPPSYLRRPAQVFDFSFPVELPKGSFITVRGTPRFENRTLVLFDGKTESPFVSDANGGLTARYQVMESRTVNVAARLGNVRILQAQSLELVSVADAPPEVTLERTAEHVDIAKDGELVLRYRVSDDHGIAQVWLELSAASQKEIRPLVKLDNETRHFEGAYRLRADDPLVAQTVGAVEVKIVALDANEVDGPQNGQSVPVYINPPAIGAESAERMQALGQLRDAVVDLYALVRDGATPSLALTQLTQQVRPAAGRAEAQLRLRGKGGASIRNFVRAQIGKLSAARLRSPNAEAVVGEVVVAIDAVMTSLGQHDAEQVSRRLALLAGEIEQNARLMSGKEQKAGLSRTLNERLLQLKSGAMKLSTLGVLGADLGQVTLAGTARIGQAAGHADYINVARAASFLAERLNRPTPSFVGGSQASVESGAGRRHAGSPLDPSSRPSEADTRFDRVLNEISQLAEEHRRLIEGVTQQVEGLEHALDAAPGSDEDLKRASHLRRAVEGLPSVGGDPGTPSAAAALAKEMVMGAAESLARHQVVTALDSLRKAESALLEASNSANSTPAGGGYTQPLSRDSAEISAVRGWLVLRVQALMSLESARARPAFQGLSAQEKELSERAMAIVNRESKVDSVLPDDVRQDLSTAARYLKEASAELAIPEGRSALSTQRRAQELLERSSLPEDDATSAPRDGASSPGGRPDRQPRAEGPVPTTGDAEARERFRRRVLEGLGGEKTPESEGAIRRYVEGLLR